MKLTPAAYHPHAVTHVVPLALQGLTTAFGMGSDVAPALKPGDFVVRLPQAIDTCLTLRVQEPSWMERNYDPAPVFQV